MIAATEKPGARFVSWVAEDEARVDEVLAWGRKHGVSGPVSRWPTDRLRACREHLLREIRARKVSTVDTPGAAVSLPDHPYIKTGADFFRFLKRESDKRGVALLDYVQDWAERDKGWPRYLGGWDLVQVAEGLEEVYRKLAEAEAPAVAPAPESAPGLSTVDTPGRSVEAEETLDWMRRRLYDYALEVGALQSPNRKLTGKDIAQICVNWGQLDPKGRRLSTIRGCTDVALLADFLSIASEQVHRLRATQPPSLLPEAPTLPPEQLALFGPAPGGEGS